MKNIIWTAYGKKYGRCAWCSLDFYLCNCKFSYIPAADLRKAHKKAHKKAHQRHMSELKDMNQC